MNLKLGIVGWPLTKTYSPLIHKLLGEFLGINVEYQKVPIENLDRQKIQDVNLKYKELKNQLSSLQQLLINGERH